MDVNVFELIKKKTKGETYNIEKKNNFITGYVNKIKKLSSPQPQKYKVIIEMPKSPSKKHGDNESFIAKLKKLTDMEAKIFEGTIEYTAEYGTLYDEVEQKIPGCSSYIAHKKIFMTSFVYKKAKAVSNYDDKTEIFYLSKTKVTFASLVNDYSKDFPSKFEHLHYFTNCPFPYVGIFSHHKNISNGVNKIMGEINNSVGKKEKGAPVKLYDKYGREGQYYFMDFGKLDINYFNDCIDKYMLPHGFANFCLVVDDLVSQGNINDLKVIFEEYDMLKFISLGFDSTFFLGGVRDSKFTGTKITFPHTLDFNKIVTSLHGDFDKLNMAVFVFILVSNGFIGTAPLEIFFDEEKNKISSLNDVYENGMDQLYNCFLLNLLYISIFKNDISVVKDVFIFYDIIHTKGIHKPKPVIESAINFLMTMFIKNYDADKIIATYKTDSFNIINEGKKIIISRKINDVEQNQIISQDYKYSITKNKLTITNQGNVYTRDIIFFENITFSRKDFLDCTNDKSVLPIDILKNYEARGNKLVCPGKPDLSIAGGEIVYGDSSLYDISNIMYVSEANKNNLYFINTKDKIIKIISPKVEFIFKYDDKYDVISKEMNGKNIDNSVPNKWTEGLHDVYVSGMDLIIFNDKMDFGVITFNSDFTRFDKFDKKSFGMYLEKYAKSTNTNYLSYIVKIMENFYDVQIENRTFIDCEINKVKPVIENFYKKEIANTINFSVDLADPAPKSSVTPQKILYCKVGEGSKLIEKIKNDVYDTDIINRYDVRIMNKNYTKSIESHENDHYNDIENLMRDPHHDKINKIFEKIQVRLQKVEKKINNIDRYKAFEFPCYDFSNNYDYLISLYELFTGSFIYKSQYDLINKMIDTLVNGHGKYYQMLMGSGKTSFIIPIVCIILMITQPKNIFVVQPNNLADQTHKIFMSNVVPLIAPKIKLVYPNDHKFKVDGNNNIFILKDSIFKKHMIEKKATYDFYLIMDEVDELSNNLKCELNVVDNKDKKKIPFLNLRVNLIGRAIKYVLDEYKGNKINNRYYIKPLEVNTILKGVTGSILKDKKLFYNDLSNDRENGRSALEVYLEDLKRKNDPDAKVVESFVGSCSKVTDPHVNEPLAIIGRKFRTKSEYLCNKILKEIIPIIFSKTYNFEYGIASKLSPEENQNRYYAVPFLSVDTPSKTSNFSDIDICISYTFLSYYYYSMAQDLPDYIVDYFFKAIKNVNLIKRNEFRKSFNKKFNFGDFELFAFFIEKVIDKEYNYFEVAQNISFCDVFCDRSFKHKVGITGTPFILPFKDVNGSKNSACCINLQKGANGNIVNNITKMKIIKCDNVINIVHGSDFVNQMKKHHFFIDVGAFFIDYEPKQVAQKLFNVLDRRIIYITDEGPRTHAGEKFVGETKDSDFVFFDQSRITGVDMQLYSTGVGLISVTSRTRFRDLAQGMYRLRKIGMHGGQTANMITYDDAIIKGVPVDVFLNNELLNQQKMLHYYLIQHFRSMLRSKTSTDYNVIINSDHMSKLEILKAEYKKNDKFLDKIFKLIVNNSPSQTDQEHEQEKEQEKEQEQEKLVAHKINKFDKIGVCYPFILSFSNGEVVDAFRIHLMGKKVFGDAIKILNTEIINKFDFYFTVYAYKLITSYKDSDSYRIPSYVYLSYVTENNKTYVFYDNEVVFTGGIKFSKINHKSDSTLKMLTGYINITKEDANAYFKRTISAEEKKIIEYYGQFENQHENYCHYKLTTK